MRAALVRRQRMDLVDDHRAGRRQHLPAGLRAEEDVERFRRRHHDMRRPAMHAGAFGGRGVAGPDPGADFDLGQAQRRELRADAGERRLEVAVDVVRQRLQRRDIDDMRLVGQRALEALADEIVERGEEGRERLAGPGRRGDQRMAPGLDRRPGAGLRGGRGCGRSLRTRRRPRDGRGSKRARRRRSLCEPPETRREASRLLLREAGKVARSAGWGVESRPPQA